MNLLKSYYRYMQAPQEALQTFAQERAFKEACFGFFIAALSSVLAFNLAEGMSVPMFLLKLAILFVAELTAGYIIASFCALFLDFSRVKTAPAELFVMVGFSGYIKSLLLVFALFNAALPWAQLRYLTPCVLLLVLGLQVAFLTRGVMRTYDVKPGKALGAWLFACVPVLLLFVLTGVFCIWALTWLF